MSQRNSLERIAMLSARRQEQLSRVSGRFTESPRKMRFGGRKQLPKLYESLIMLAGGIALHATKGFRPHNNVTPESKI